MRRKPFTCPDCRRELSPDTPKVTTKGRTICGDCAYRAEHPQAVALAKPRQRRKSGADQLTLLRAALLPFGLWLVATVALGLLAFELLQPVARALRVIAS